MRRLIACLIFSGLLASNTPAAQKERLKLSLSDYEDRVHGAWLGQTIGALMGFQFEGKVNSSPLVWVNQYPRQYEAAPVDDDYYYELVALRAFEKYGITMTLDQLGEQWKENSAGSWGSSEQTRLALANGIPGSQAGHPRYNRVWWTIGPQFSADIYGMLAPGHVNLAGKLARKYGHINGDAEGVDGAVFMAGMVSLAFRETDPRAIVREAAQLIHPESPYRQCLDLVISMAEKGKTPEEIFSAVEDRWHIEYPAMNNAVANGGLVATSLWFGEGDYLKTVNLVYRAADFSDADCNAANAGAVVGAMRGTKGLPAHLVVGLGDRLVGHRMGSVDLTPPVEETISVIAKRITKIGQQILASNGGSASATHVTAPIEPARTQPADLFKLADLTEYWNRNWKLGRAGFGGIPDSIPNAPQTYPRATYLEGDVLATWPRDEIRGVVFWRRTKLSSKPSLTLDVGADAGRTWQLSVYVNNTRVLVRTIEGGASSGERAWETIQVDLSEFREQEVEIRLYQRTLIPNKIPGNAYWRTITLR